MKTFFLLINKLDKYLLGTSVLLALVGLLMIYSTTFTEQANSGLLLRQIFFLIVGLVLFFSFSSLDYRYLKKIRWPIYLAGTVLLIGVLVVGFRVRGSVRWFDLGILQLQPVEYMKLAMIIFLGLPPKRMPERNTLVSTTTLSIFYNGIRILLGPGSFYGFFIRRKTLFIRRKALLIKIFFKCLLAFCKNLFKF